MLKNFKQKLKYHFKEVIRTKKSPHSIALGFTIGTLIAILPTPGFSFLLVLFIILIFKKINKFSLIGAMLIWNPIVLVLIYYLSYQIGDLLFGNLPVVKYNIVIFDQLYNFSRRFLVGNFIIAVTTSLLSYIVIRKIIDFYRKNEKN
jgi:uncharacterized protein